MQGLKYHVDIVFCVDVSGSMVERLDDVKMNILQWPSDFIAALAKEGKVVARVRVRLVLFADLLEAPESLRATEFFVVYQQPESDTPEPNTQLAEFKSVVYALSVSGSGNGPVSALEALSIAIGSNWTHEDERQRHVVVMFSNASAHKLESRVGQIPEAFREHVPASLDELWDYWDGNQTAMLRKLARRLVIFAPDAYPWNVIADAWGNTIWLISQAGDSLDDEYELILNNTAH